MSTRSRAGRRARALVYIAELRARGFLVRLDWWPGEGYRGLHLVPRDRAHLDTLDEEDVGMLAWLQEDMEDLLEEALDVHVCGAVTTT